MSGDTNKTRVKENIRDKNNREQKQAIEQTPVSFDDYVDSYKSEIDGSIGFIGQDTDFFVELKANLLAEIAEKHFKDTGKVKALDIGSGVGMIDKFLKKRIGNITGVDVEAGIVEKAKINNPEAQYIKYDGLRLPFEDGSFELCFAVNVMHHVPPELWENFTKEMHRVLKPGGIAAVFEHNPLNPLTRLAVARCEFDRDAVLLSHGKVKKLLKHPGMEIDESGYIVFFPFKAAIFRRIEKYLGFIPFGAQHFAAGMKK